MGIRDSVKLESVTLTDFRSVLQVHSLGCPHKRRLTKMRCKSSKSSGTRYKLKS